VEDIWEPKGAKKLTGCDVPCAGFCRESTYNTSNTYTPSPSTMTSFQDEFKKSVVEIGAEILDLSDKFQKLTAKDYDAMYATVSKNPKRNVLIKRLLEFETTLASLRIALWKRSMTAEVDEDPVEEEPVVKEGAKEAPKEVAKEGAKKRGRPRKTETDASVLDMEKNKDNKDTAAPESVVDAAIPAIPETPETPADGGGKSKRTKGGKKDSETADTSETVVPNKTIPEPEKNKSKSKSNDTKPEEDVGSAETASKKARVSKDTKAPVESKDTKAPVESKAAVEAKDSDEEALDAPIHLRRKKIPKHVKTLVWNEFIGSDLKNGRCFSCRKTTIENTNFHCGHVIAESKGGNLTIQNLRPICAPCNGSMGTMSMEEFTKTFFGHTV
jgi:hypothetical protein